MRTPLTALLCLFLAVMTLPGQPGERVNPLTTPADEAQGGRTFRIRCARCHGIDGAGGRGPDLTAGRYRHGATDSDLFENISRGIPNTRMPHHSLPEERIWQLVSYLRTLAEQPVPVDLEGDAAAGERLFRGKGDCLRCHRVEGTGGRLGPDLSEVGWRLSADHLRSSIVDPNQVVPLPYWTLRLRDQGGRVVQGIRLNEDSYSIQDMDVQENLLSLWKKDVREQQHEPRSLMPDYGGLLTEAEVEDLVAYLYSLRGRGGP